MSVGDLSSLSGTPHPTGSDPVLRVRVTKAPSALTDSVVVVIVGGNPDWPETIPSANWQPNGASLPHVGDHGSMVTDHQGDNWLVGFNRLWT